MRKYIITIDGGTTNTRVALWDEDKKIKYFVKSKIGVRDVAREGNNNGLKKTLRQMIQRLMEDKKLSFDNIESIYACGMLTSNVGIWELPHLPAPAGIEDYLSGIQEETIPDIIPYPICFIPGMKNRKNVFGLDEVDCMDMMRGEEMETIALMERFPDKAVLYVLPGSHTKFVSVNEKGQMTGCLTSMAGEILSLLTENSILADAVGKSFATTSYNQEMLFAGAKESWKSGLSRAAFLTRIVSQFVAESKEECASFLLGAVLADDIRAAKDSNALAGTEKMKIVIAGKEPLSSALQQLFLQEGTFSDVHVFENSENVLLSGYGMCLIHEKRRQVNVI